MSQFNSNYPNGFQSTSPGTDVVPVTPTNSTNLPAGPCRGLLVGTAGTIVAVTFNGNNRTFYAPVGVIPVCFTQVWATGTTASNISAIY